MSINTHLTLTTNRQGLAGLGTRSGASWKPVHAIADARRLLKHFDAKLHRTLLGSYWHKRLEQRLTGMAFVENIHSNIHWHIVADRSPLGCHDIAFRKACQSAWSSLAPAGDALFQIIAGPSDLKAVINYDTKDLWRTEQFDALQFLPWVHC